VNIHNLRTEYSTVFNPVRRYPRNVRPNKPPAGTLQRRSIDVEDDYEFRDFIESITVTKEELAAIVSRPGYSIPEVRQYLRAKPRLGAANRSLNAALAAVNDDRPWLFALWARRTQMIASTSIKKLAAVLDGKVAGRELGR
jgi:hypothetical protein